MDPMEAYRGLAQGGSRHRRTLMESDLDRFAEVQVNENNDWQWLEGDGCDKSLFIEPVLVTQADGTIFQRMIFSFLGRTVVGLIDEFLPRLGQGQEQYPRRNLSV